MWATLARGPQREAGSASRRPAHVLACTLCMLAAMTSGCDSEVLVKAELREVPLGTATLSVVASLNSDPWRPGSIYRLYAPELFSVADAAETVVIGLKLPRNTAGSLRLAVQPLDASGSPVQDAACKVAYFGTGEVVLGPTENSLSVDIDPQYLDNLNLPSNAATMNSIRGLLVDPEAAPADLTKHAYSGDDSGNILMWDGCSWHGPATVENVPVRGLAVTPAGTLWSVGGLATSKSALSIHNKPSGMAWQSASAPPDLVGVLNQVKTLSTGSLIAMGSIWDSNARLPVAWIEGDGYTWNHVAYPGPSYTAKVNSFDQAGRPGCQYLRVGQVDSAGDTARLGYVRGNVSCASAGSPYTFVNPWNTAPAELLSMAVVKGGAGSWLGGHNYLAFWNGLLTTTTELGSDPVLAGVTVLDGLPPESDVTAIWVPDSSPTTAYLTLATASNSTALVRVDGSALTGLLPSPIPSRMYTLAGSDLGGGDVDLWLAGDGGVRFRYLRVHGRVQSTLFQPPK